MGDSKRNARKLGFERLELKAAPSAALWGQPAAADSLADSPQSADVGHRQLPESNAHWRCRHDTRALLEYVHASTAEPVTVSWALPSVQQTVESDRMLARGLDAVLNGIANDPVGMIETD